jgi:predicted RNA-binding Zn ribbon-like protein
VESIEYPLLGEPPVIEFVNTLYDGPDGEVDFLGSVELARGWFSAVTPTVLSSVDLLDERARRDLVRLRSAIRTVFDAVPVDALDEAVELLESTVNASPGRVRLTVTDHGRLVARTAHDTARPAGTAALLAHGAVTIAAEPSSGRVLVCDRPACHMRYLQQHRRRRYCNPACANADRQARFQQRHKN